MTLPDLDLNLWRVFQQLMLHRHVSRAAEALGVTQPAVSNALARLRQHLGDELFSRGPRGMVPTPLALQLAEPVAQALGLLGDAVQQRGHFDPAASKRRFCIGMTDIGELYFLPRLVESIGREAPGVTLSTVRNTSVNLQDEMAAGHVDLAIGLLPQLPAGTYQQQLFTQRYVCLFRRGHPLDGKRLTLKGYRAARHVVIVAQGTGHGIVDDLLARQGIERHVALTVPHFVGVGHLLQGTDLVATVPERFAERMVEPFGLRMATPPAELPTIAIRMHWHGRVHRDPANKWLRQTIFGLYAESAR